MWLCVHLSYLNGVNAYCGIVSLPYCLPALLEYCLFSFVSSLLCMHHQLIVISVTSMLPFRVVSVLKLDF